MKYCRNCGKMLEDDVAFCPSCGTKCDPIINYNDIPRSRSKGGNALTTVAFIFFIVSIVTSGLAFLQSLVLLLVEFTYGLSIFFSISTLGSIALNSFFAYKVRNAVNEGETLSLGFKICTLIFGNLVSGICLLCDKDH